MGRTTHLVAATALLGAGVLAGLSAPTATAASGSCPAPAVPMRFSEPGYVDMTRAGGEPIVFTHPDGTLLYGAHAGTTHFFSPESADEQILAFGGKYNGQTYYWFSDDDGLTWSYVDRTLPPNGTPASGFSDPEFAYDTAGNVYVSEINLVNISMSKSTDVGRSYQQQNFFAQVLSDRQWTEGDEEDVVYMVGNVISGGTFPGDPVGNSGHLLFKSKDGGATFASGIPDDGGEGDLRVDKSDGTLYEALRLSGSELYLRAYRGARGDDFTPEDNLIVDGVSMLSHWPSFDLDPSGNLYITWDESGVGDREAGIYYSYSTDRGKTWATPLRLDADEKTDIWPWLAVGDDGKVGVAWFQADEELPDHDAQTEGDHGWRVVAAQTLNGLGCGTSTVPGFTRSIAVGADGDDPFHTGTVCQGGTGCQATATDRRLGDYFSIEVSGAGQLVVAYSDTRLGGPVSLPGFVRQIEGASFLGASAPVPPAPGPAPAPAPAPAPGPGTPLPSTGGGLAGSGLALLLAALVIRRVRRLSATRA